MKPRLLAVAAIVALAPIAAHACEEVHALQATFDGGDYLVSVNGVPVTGGEGYMSGAIPFMPVDYVRQGENTVEVTTTGAEATAKLELMKGCVGGFDLEGPLDQANLTGDGSATLTFQHAAPVEASHTRAEAAGEDGLMEAVAALQAAVEAGDVGTVLELHAPMVADAQRMGMPVERLQGMLGFFFENGEKTMRTDLQVATAMEDRVFIVTAADGAPPIDVLVKDGDGVFNWRSGAIWGRIDGKWGVLNLYY